MGVLPNFIVLKNFIEPIKRMRNVLNFAVLICIIKPMIEYHQLLFPLNRHCIEANFI